MAKTRLKRKGNNTDPSSSPKSKIGYVRYN
jgi:hypothetical protein